MMAPFIMMVCIGIIAITIPIWGDIFDFIYGCYISIFCIDIMHSPNNEKLDTEFLRIFSQKQYHMTRKLLYSNPSKLLAHLDGVKNFEVYTSKILDKDGKELVITTFSNIMRELLIKYPKILPKVEFVIAEKSKKKSWLLMDYAIAIQDLNISKKGLLVAANDPTTKSKLVKMFKDDEEIQKLASII